MVDLPEPEVPTSATHAPAGIFKLICFRIKSSDREGYRN
jgi:hypothetical protein